MSSDLIAEERADLERCGRDGQLHCTGCLNRRELLVITLEQAEQRAAQLEEELRQRAERAEAERDEARADSQLLVYTLRGLVVDCANRGWTGPKFEEARRVAEGTTSGAPLLAELERLRAVAEVAKSVRGKILPHCWRESTALGAALDALEARGGD